MRDRGQRDKKGNKEKKENRTEQNRTEEKTEIEERRKRYNRYREQTLLIHIGDKRGVWRGNMRGKKHHVCPAYDSIETERKNIQGE